MPPSGASPASARSDCRVDRRLQLPAIGAHPTGAFGLTPLRQPAGTVRQARHTDRQLRSGFSHRRRKFVTALDKLAAADQILLMRHGAHNIRLAQCSPLHGGPTDRLFADPRFVVEDVARSCWPVRKPQERRVMATSRPTPYRRPATIYLRARRGSDYTGSPGTSLWWRSARLCWPSPPLPSQARPPRN